MLLRGRKSSGRFVGWLPASLALLLVLIFPAAARAISPCCNIIGIDSRSGVVTARVNATGQTFEFTVKNSGLLSSLKVGQGVYANLGAKQVSLDGRTISGVIVSMGGATAPAAPPAGRPGIPAAAAAQTQPSRAARGAGPCCDITGIDSQSGIVTARVNATDLAFQFAVKNSGLLSSLKVGQGIYANLGAKQVSLDGRAVCCAIVSMGAATAPATLPAGRPGIPPTASAPNQTSAPAAHPAGRPGILPVASAPTQSSGAAQAVPQKASGLGVTARRGLLTAYTLPTVTAGTPFAAPPRGTAGSFREIEPGGRPSAVNSNAVHLRGPEGILQAANLPEGAKNLLLLHAYTLGPGESDHYVVNTQLANEWIKSHPALAKVQPPSSHNSHSGCPASRTIAGVEIPMSTDCLSEAAKHAVSETERKKEEFLDASRKEWQHITDELTHDLSMVPDCFADKRLDLPNIPVQFTLPNEFTMGFQEAGSRDNASDKVKGTITLGLPVTADFKADLTLFYIPCLPFAIRPRSLGADGTLTLGTNLGAALNATGGFSKSFKIPPEPGGGPHFPIAIIPIVLAGVPLAEMDVSIYIDGTVDVDGEGELDAHFKLNAPHETAFSFECDGHGCGKHEAHRVSQPVTTTEDVKVSGRIHVKPKIYAALQLDFEFNALSARAGPEPYLLGELYGCGAASATQSTAGPTTTTGSYALTADLDWGLDLRAEALVGGKQVGPTLRPSLLDPQHLKFWDLAGSTALLPGLEGVPPVVAGSDAIYKIRMPSCYPYTEDVEYRVSWSGGATAENTTIAPANMTAAQTLQIVRRSPGSGTISAAAVQRETGRISPVAQPNPGSGNTSACTFEAGQADCRGNPGKDLPIKFVWPAMGNSSLSVTLLGDKHHRVFTEKERTTHLDISVQ